MPEPGEPIARALSCLQGHPPDIRFEGKPMWQRSYPKQMLRSRLSTSPP
jgi:hypothetical protein